MTIETKVYARAGLAGNPSDGYFGKTLSCSVRNFAATVHLSESPKVAFEPAGPGRYPSLRQFMRAIEERGYRPGFSLAEAAIKRFVDYCDQRAIALDGANFTFRYSSTIPRCVGLAGSSALVTATLNALAEFYGMHIPKAERPNLALQVETEELGIAAGLQDRVIQVYEGCVFMDFSEGLIMSQGYGNYETIDPVLLPPLYVAYRTDLAESSNVFHDRIRHRWLERDPEVHQAMHDFAEYAQAARDLIVAGRGHEIGPFLDKNFDRRNSIANLDSFNVGMVMRARNAGASAKFAGSGGAIVGTYEDEAMFTRIEAAFKGLPVVVIKPLISPIPQGATDGTNLRR